MLRLGALGCTKTLANFAKSKIVDVAEKENLAVLNTLFVRKTSFYSRISKDQLWKGVLSLSNPGKKKGRGKRKSNASMAREKKFESPNGSIWPGFNSHVLKGDSVATLNPVMSTKKQQLEEPVKKTRLSRKVHPLERGWSGRLITGKKIGPPNPTNGQSYEGFESIVLEHKASTIMTSIFGRRRQFYSIVATGNGNGLIGLAAVKKFDSKISIKLAQKKASLKLLEIDLIEKHTVNHDFFSEYRNTKVFVFKKPKGFGLQCHRVIMALCKLIGIENLSAKVEGSCNVPNIIRAFIVGLLRQKTYQQIADEKKLHLVEYKEESHNFPLVIASPKECLTLAEARRNPVVFEEYIMGNLVFRQEKKVPFYQHLPSWNTYLLKTLFCRNHNKVKIDLLVKYGEYKSHLNEIYPNHKNTSKKEGEDNITQ